MTALAPAGNHWPSRLAYAAAGIFIGASGAVNVAYGWQKGSDLAGSLTWAGVAAAVAVVFALSWPALIRSVEARRWSAAVMALAALALSGSFSVTAALGSAAGGRMNAAATETATTSARARAQAAYDAAKADLDKLVPARATGELEALLEAAQRNPRTKGCAGDGTSARVTCPKLEAEHARARQRDRLQAAVDKASEALNVGPAKVANSDAKALARYLAAIGIAVGADRLNDLLVLLAVLMIEAGGGLSLALGLALQAPPVVARHVSADGGCTDPERPRTPPANALDAPAERSPHASYTPERERSDVQDAAVLAWLRARGGTAKVSMRRLGAELGRSAGGAHAEIRRLVAAGMLNAAPTSRGTLLTLTPSAKLN